MVLTEGDLDQIIDKVLEITAESQNMVEDHYGELITVLLQSIPELKIWVQTSIPPTQIGQGLHHEILIETTFRMRIMYIPVAALQFDSAKVKQQAKGWDHFNMNMASLPTPILQELHQGIRNELKEHEHPTSHLNIQIEQENVALKKQFNQTIKDKEQAQLQQQRLKEVVKATCK